MQLKSNLKSLASFLTVHGVAFCKGTGLHGWKYIVSESSIYDRSFWFVTCFAALALSISLVALSWIDFRSDPIMTLPLTTQRPMGSLFFPTVTICSFNKISKRAAFDMAQKLNKDNYTTVEKLAHTLKLLSRLIDNKYHTLPEKEYNLLSTTFKENKIREHEAFEQMAPSCDELLKKCKWLNKNINCSFLFQSSKSPVGFCCSSNYNGLKTSIHQRERLQMAHLLRNTGCVSQTGLEVLLDNDPSDYFMSNVPSVGFQVQIHNPFDFPHFALPTYLIEINTNNFITISTEITGPSMAVQSMDSLERNCLMVTERQMSVTTRYTYQNCISECKVATIMEICGCVPFYLLVNADTTRLPCTIKDQKCIAMNQDIIFDINHHRPTNGESNNKCKCYPNCAYYSFQPYLSKGPLDLTYLENPRSIESGRYSDNFTVLRVFSSSLKARAYRREVKFSGLGLLGFFAGLVGLLTAFSFITVVEFVYLLIMKRNRNVCESGKARVHRITVAAFQYNPNELQL